MKQLVKPIAIVAAAIIASLSIPANASVKHGGPSINKTVNEPVAEKKFTVHLQEPDVDKRICLTITNPGMANLYVSLISPDGTAIDNFFTGKKFMQMKRVYNFSMAEEGTYSIEVKSATEKVVRKIKLEYAGVKTVEKLTID